MNKEQVIEAIKAADIKVNPYDWYDRISGQIEDKYARGQLDAKVAQLGDIFCSDDEEYREELLRWCSWDIWGK